MKKRISNISSENRLLIVLAFVSLSTGIWSKYRQLWLQDAGYSIAGISRILSVALICSSVVSFIISVFSTKIKIKDIVALAFIFRIISMIGLLVFDSDYLIKLCVLLCIMCEVIFSISFYPLLNFESKKEIFKRKMLVDYFFKDIGVVACGLLFGVSLGKYVFDYNWCLIISIVAALFAFLFLIPLKSHQKNKKSTSLKKSLNSIFSNRINRGYLIKELIGYIAYGIVFDLMMLILTNYIGFDVTFTSIFIIVSNMFGTVFSFVVSKFSKNYSVSLSAIIKYGTRSLVFFIAFLLNKNIVFIFAIIYSYIMSRILEDKVTGSFLEIIDEDSQFLFGNLRYFTLSLGEGIGAFLAGVLISHSLRVLFLGASVCIFMITVILVYLDKIKKDYKNS